MKNKTVIINVFGSPGAGKSTTAAYIFYKLKMLGYKCELVTEFAKDKTYEKNKTALNNQIFMFANQNYRIDQIIKNEDLDFIVTDSPLLLNILYNKNGEIDKALNNLVDIVFNQYNNFNIFLNPSKDYKTYGRNQTEEESKEISKSMFRLFFQYIDLVMEKDEVEYKFPKIIKFISKKC